MFGAFLMAAMLAFNQSSDILESLCLGAALYCMVFVMLDVTRSPAYDVLDDEEDVATDAHREDDNQ